MDGSGTATIDANPILLFSRYVKGGGFGIDQKALLCVRAIVETATIPGDQKVLLLVDVIVTQLVSALMA
jgi:hypothetical protein